MVRRICLILLFCLVVGVSVKAAPDAAQGPGKIIEELKLFSKTLGAIHEAYVGDTNPRGLFYAAAEGMLSSLGDKYAQFFDPEKYELLQMHMRGEYAGIGVILQIVEAYPQVMDLKPDSPAAKAGVRVHDRIIEIDGTDVKNKDLPEVAKLLRGEAESDVRLFILRKKKKITITVKREKIEIDSVQDARVVMDNIGYFRIAHFQDHTAKQVAEALNKLDNQGVKALIIDLRGNDGGLLDQAVELAGFFLPEGSRVVSVRSKIKVQQKEHLTASTYGRRNLPLAVLVDGKSASASEIFSACMQDYGRAFVIGAQTFGKASVQSVVPLDEQTAMKFTTARYLSPKGRMIDGVGIEPDEVINPATEEGVQEWELIRALNLLKKQLQ